jgi:hypothetical protein
MVDISGQDVRLHTIIPLLLYHHRHDGAVLRQVVTAALQHVGNRRVLRELLQQQPLRRHELQF